MTMQETLNALEEVKQAINLAYASGYSAGKQQRPWQGLTYEEIESAISDGFARGLDDGNISNQTVINYVRGIEAKLKELNNG